ncbi:GRB10-interacting GYF protein 2 isoform X2 [Acanthopagrus latus]|nr:GRB10-interacting GYF protein 2 isoform X2 [Acanthopagrus latus]
MLTRWLMLTAFLAASANPERAAFTVTPTCRVKGHPELELTLNCGDRENAGVVQYWHTPFGDLQSPGSHSKLDPVFMHHDGSLVLHNTSTLHSGLYYCLLRHTEGTTLWPYQLHVSHDNKEYSKYEQHSSCGAFRFRRDVGSEAERQEGISDGQFAGAVAASVLLTFVFGFSAGALSRTHVLRCLGAVTTKMPSPWKRRSRADTPDHAPTVTMTTPPAMYDNQTFEMEQVEISSTNSPPPPKPQRSFRDKRREEQETTTYLEGCDYKQEEEREKVEVAGGSLEERNNGSVVEEEERGEGGGSHTETDDEESSEEGEMENGESREEITKEKEVEEEGEQQNKNKDGEWSRGGEEVVEKGSDEDREEEEGKRKEEDGETGSDKQEDPEPATSPPRPSRRSRVIRLYQYDDDGQRYCHLPDPTPNEPGPAPRLKQRSLSLTRLSAIMTAASAGPLDTEETGREERTHFHMEI